MARSSSIALPPVSETAAERVARLEAELAAARQDLAADPAATRTHARVARASTGSSSLKEGATATDRWSREDLRVRLDGAPAFRIKDRVGDERLARICEAYTKITGDPVRTERPWKKNLIAAAYRVHGDDFLPFVADQFEASGTATNLLGFVRSSPPRDLALGVPAHAPQSDVARDGRTGVPRSGQGSETPDVRRPFTVEDDEAPCPDRDTVAQDETEDADDEWAPWPAALVQVAGDDLVPGLLYGKSERPPPFDLKSRRRWDDRPSNPDRDAILAERARLVGSAGGTAA